MIDLFTNTILFFNLLIISTAWFATGMMFYGLSIYMPEFKSTDIRLITFLLGLAEIPADMVPIVALNRFDISITLINEELHFTLNKFSLRLCSAFFNFADAVVDITAYSITLWVEPFVSLPPLYRLVIMYMSGQ